MIAYTETTAPQQDTLLKIAALDLASQGTPVFPCHSINEAGACTCSKGAACEHPGKHPRTRNGFYDATTDPRVVNKWWNKWPNANIGVPTGQESGRFVLDVDPRHGGNESLATLVGKHGELPGTIKVKTGGDGTHHLFAYPIGEDVRSKGSNKGSKLGPGLDIKANGGFVIVPPSVTASAYEWLDDVTPLANPPEWLLEAIREPHRDASRRSSPSQTSPACTNGEAIPEGTRDNTLTSFAGKLHDGTRTLDDLVEDLSAINEARCSPPLPEAQVRKIAKSIISRPHCQPSRGTTPETLEALDAIQIDLEQQECSGMGQHTDRDFMLTLAKQARQHGTMIQPVGSALPAGGVRLELSIRDAALAASISKRTTEKSIKRCKMAGRLRQDNAERKGAEAGAFILVVPTRAGVGHSTISSPPEKKDGQSVLPLRAPRLRWSGPHPYDPEARIRRLGKTRGRVIDHLEAGPATLEVLARRLKVRRLRDLRRRVLPPLIEAGIVKEYLSGHYRLAPDYLEALAREREGAGEVAATRRDIARYAREREAYQRRHGMNPDYAPSQREMDRRRGEREKADGEISELRSIADVPGLTPEQSAQLEAIWDYELAHGCGSFRWDQASSKRLFYSREGRGHWPDPEELERLRDYLVVTGELHGVA